MVAVIAIQRGLKMSCNENVSVCVTQGNDWFLDITVTEDGAIGDDSLPVNPKDLTGASVSMPLKETKDGATIATPTATITNAGQGKITFRQTAAQTETLITAGQGSRFLYGAPKIVYSDGTVDDLFDFTLEIHESWN